MTDTYVAEFVARHRAKATGTISLHRAVDTIREYEAWLVELEAEQTQAYEELSNLEERVHGLERSIDQTRTRIALYRAMAEEEDAMRRRLPALRTEPR